MSGHSKWSSIKHKKALTDAKKGKVFSKLAALISVTAKTGGDPSTNPNLRLYVDKARQAGMPKDNIERAIRRGTGELGGAQLEEVTYEAYGSGGVGIIIEGVTDNKNRTVAGIKAILNKYNAKLAELGSVNYLFDKQGVIIVAKNEKSTDDIELLAIDAGAEDFVEEGGQVIIYTTPTNLENTKKRLEAEGLTVESAEVSLVPKVTVPVEESKKEGIMKLLDALDDLDDVTNISTNAGV